jgi:deferrochelatase/peroxidase EfeB
VSEVILFGYPDGTQQPTLEMRIEDEAVVREGTARVLAA